MLEPSLSFTDTLIFRKQFVKEMSGGHTFAARIGMIVKLGYSDHNESAKYPSF